LNSFEGARLQSRRQRVWVGHGFSRAVSHTTNAPLGAEVKLADAYKFVCGYAVILRESNSMAKLAEPTTIAVQDASGVKRKITKIIHHSSGGFAVLAPYHKARSGLLLKIPLDYGVKGESWIPLADCIGYSADDRVKLSFHPDGFVQFSGENPAKILSGRDPETGQPKGLGLMTNPLSQPIRSGPTFGISAWGLTEFEELEPNRNNVIIFSQEEMYYRGCLPGTSNGVHVEAFVLEPRYWSGVRGNPSDMKLSLCVGMFEAAGTALELKVIPMDRSNGFIAVLASHSRFSFPEESDFTLNGPSESVSGSRKNALIAIYPVSLREKIQQSVKSAENLNYNV
jgi:hypothetical protein